MEKYSDKKIKTPDTCYKCQTALIDTVSGNLEKNSNMTDKLDFDDWWSDFTYQFRNDKDGGYEQLKRLISEVRSFSVDKREAFINELLKRGEYKYYSCALISEFGTNQQVQIIKDWTLELIDNNSDDSILSECINVIITRFQQQDNSILNKYFIDYQTRNQRHIRIHGELFNVNKDLFLKAFAINIDRYPIDILCDYDGLLYMTKYLDGLDYLIKNLPYLQSEKLKLFALAKVNHSVSDFDKVLKARLIELSDIKKSEFEQIKQIRLNVINKRQPPTRAHTPLGFKWLGVLRSRLQTFCSVDRKAST